MMIPPHPLRVCVATGTRADYGLLKPVMQALRQDPRFVLQVIASAMHLAPEFGSTKQEITADGFAIDAEVAMLLSADTAEAAAKSMGLGVIGFADALGRLRPDLLLLLGDRFEALSAAATAVLLKIPIAHVSGGDITLGAFDDQIRHAITKMAHLHFTASEESAARVRQMGEPPERIFAVGDPGLDALRTMTLMSRRELSADLGMQWQERNILVTFHPATLDPTPAAAQLAVLLQALAALGSSVGLVFTKANADPEGRRINAMLEDFVGSHRHAVLYSSLGHRRYLSVMAQCDAVVGNSSSGLLEAPSLSIPTVNVGSRQMGRLRAASVFDVAVEASAIQAAIEAAFARGRQATPNPYGDGHAADRIVAVLAAITTPSGLLPKPFHSPACTS